MDANIDEIEKLSKELNELEKTILDDHTKETAKELSNFIKTKQKLAVLTEKQKQEKKIENFNNPIIKDEN